MRVGRASVALAFGIGATQLAHPAIGARGLSLSRSTPPSVAAPSNLGYADAVESIREDRPLFRVHVRLDDGSAATTLQARQNDVRLGDRVEIDRGEAWRHDTRADRIDRWGYWIDAAGNRYDDQGLRVDDDN